VAPEDLAVPLLALIAGPERHKVFIIDVDAEEIDHCVQTHLQQYHPRVEDPRANWAEPKGIPAGTQKASEFFMAGSMYW